MVDKKEIEKEIRQMYFTQRLEELKSIIQLRTTGVLGVIGSGLGLAVSVLVSNSSTLLAIGVFVFTGILAGILYRITSKSYKDKSTLLRQQRERIAEIYGVEYGE